MLPTRHKSTPCAHTSYCTPMHTVCHAHPNAHHVVVNHNLNSSSKPWNGYSSYDWHRGRTKCNAQPTPDDASFPHEKFEPDSGNTVQEATAALQAFFTGLQQKEDIDSIFLNMVPDTALDALINAKRKQGKDIQSVTAHEMCQLAAVSTDEALQFGIDSYAHRLLLWDGIAHVTPLSAMCLAPMKTIHRFQVKSGKGEELVMTVTLVKQETLTTQYRSAPLLQHAWRIRSIQGEPEDDVMPTSPGAHVGPESVVAAQLAALRDGNAAGVWAFASPQNQRATGPLERFANMLQNPQFKPLLGHHRHETLRRCMYTKDKYFELVAVHSQNTGLDRKSVTMVYVWDVHRQESWTMDDASGDTGSQQRDGPGMQYSNEATDALSGAWVTQSVQLVSASNQVFRPDSLGDYL